VEAAFSQRYAPEVLALLKRRALEPDASAGDSVQGTQSGQQQAGLSPAFYQSLVERLIREQPVDEQILAQLATRRSAAIIRELTAAGGVSASRIMPGTPQQANDANEKAVTVQLQIEVSK
jgi:predicted O-methyltransferase YrrM